MKTKQISVILQNEPGALAKLASLMAASKIDMEGLMISEAVGEGFVRVIPDDPAKLTRILKQNGLRYVSDEVLAIDMTNKPGALAEASGKLGNAGINIQYAYASGLASSKRVTVILKVSDQRKALRVLK